LPELHFVFPARLRQDLLKMTNAAYPLVPPLASLAKITAGTSCSD